MFTRRTFLYFYFIFVHLFCPWFLPRATFIHAGLPLPLAFDCGYRLRAAVNNIPSCRRTALWINRRYSSPVSHQLPCLAATTHARLHPLRIFAACLLTCWDTAVPPASYRLSRAVAAADARLPPPTTSSPHHTRFLPPPFPLRTACLLVLPCFLNLLVPSGFCLPAILFPPRTAP